MSAVEQFHDAKFNPVRDEVYDFVVHELGLSPAPKENIALITPDMATDIRAKHPTRAGGYHFDDNTAVAVQSRYYVGEFTTPVYNLGIAVHETVHTATDDPDQHLFFREALPGLAELKLLEREQKFGRYHPLGAFTLKRAGGVEIWVPGNARYFDARDRVGHLVTSGEKGANTTNGMIAGVGVGLTLPVSGVRSADLFAMSHGKGRAAYYAMENSLNHLKPGLTIEVKSMPETTDGIIQGVAVIQAEARKQGLL